MDGFNLEQKLESLPAAPGVYLMKDRQGDVIYVGKAASLKHRVRSYFTRSSDTRVFIPLLEPMLGDIEIVLVASEKEALLLENELIKKHQPRFNVLLKDDKNFICLRLDPGQPFPRLEVVRRFARDGARYFGPYASAGAIRETLRIVNRYFQLRTCSDHVLANRKRPCLLFQIGRCPAPCVYDVSKEEYRRNVDEVQLFLEGKATELVDALKARMKGSAQALRFEEAALLRDQLHAIERSLERQKVASVERVDQDVFGYHREADRLLVYVLFVRQGRMAGGRAFPFQGQEFPDDELLASFVNLYYGDDNPVPKEVLLPLDIEGGGPEGLEELLSDRKGERVRVLTPKRGEKAHLLEIARKNAEQAFKEKQRSKAETAAILERLKDKLHLSKVPRRMECYDISHFQGANIVASQVAVTDGEVDKARYRRFKIKSVRTQDDFASMYEVLHRRLSRGLKEEDLPDLIVIDGGKGQLGSAHAALRDLGVEGVDLVSLAKSRDLPSENPDARVARSPERVFVLQRKEPLVLPQNSPELFMLTRIRDEAHRFAITFQKDLLRRRNFQSVLEEIPGVGEVRKKALLRHFGSLKRVREATIEELGAVEGLGAEIAERIHTYLHGTEKELSDEAAQAQGVDMETVRAASLEDANEVVAAGDQGAPPSPSR
jgi:excinuclease ABC subunit C